MGMSAMYNFRCDPDLGDGKVTCRRIPCACLTCLKMLKIPWDKDLNDKEQPWYGVNKRYFYWRNFEGCNNWRVVDLVTTNISSKDEEIVYKKITCDRGKNQWTDINRNFWWYEIKWWSYTRILNWWNGSQNHTLCRKTWSWRGWNHNTLIFPEKSHVILSFEI